MSANLAALLYLVSGALFIMALRGLSSPATSRQGNIYGMVGMAIAMVTTLASMQLSASVIALVVLGLAILLGGYLVIWHGTHLAAVLPFLVLAACPLMHIFMHRGHSHHRVPGTPEDVPPSSSHSTSSKGE